MASAQEAEEIAQQISEEEEEKGEEEEEEEKDVNSASKAKAFDEIDSSNQTSPRGVLEVLVPTMDSDNSSSRSNSFRAETELTDKDRPPASNESVLVPHGLPWKSLITGFLLRRKRALKRLATFPFTEEKSDLKQELVKLNCSEDHMDLKGPQQHAKRGKPSWRNFDYQELVHATNNFSPDMLIGKGGHAEVYKGCLSDGQLVAVKKLTKGKSEEERTGDFLTELGIIAHVDHPNAAQLLGFGVDEGLHLVLQFSPHGSLATVLHGSKEKLEWGVRFNIALGVAEGLLYLHEGCHRRIIHRDIKASNILLTKDYQPQISDFGLAKWLPDKLPHHVVFPIEGTFGYMAPEYFMHGIVNEKTDVFAFGVLLLELITGRRAVDSSQQDRQSLVMWVKPLLTGDNIQELIDPAVADAYDSSQMKRAVSVASMCIHHQPTARPNMNMVVRLLMGTDESLDLMNEAPKPFARRLPIFDASDLDDYTCSRYLNDLNRHKQLALEQ